MARRTIATGPCGCATPDAGAQRDAASSARATRCRLRRVSALLAAAVEALDDVDAGRLDDVRDADDRRSRPARACTARACSSATRWSASFALRVRRDARARACPSSALLGDVDGRGPRARSTAGGPGARPRRDRRRPRARRAPGARRSGRRRARARRARASTTRPTDAAPTLDDELPRAPTSCSRSSTRRPSSCFAAPARRAATQVVGGARSRRLPVDRARAAARAARARGAHARAATTTGARRRSSRSPRTGARATSS